jgi:hypothetical protein
MAARVRKSDAAEYMKHNIITFITRRPCYFIFLLGGHGFSFLVVFQTFFMCLLDIKIPSELTEFQINQCVRTIIMQ